MPLDAWRYGDPLEVAMREEAETCKGCKHEMPITAFGQQLLVCAKDRKHGARCRDYRENEVDAVHAVTGVLPR